MFATMEKVLKPGLKEVTWDKTEDQLLIRVYHEEVARQKQRKTLLKLKQKMIRYKLKQKKQRKRTKKIFAIKRTTRKV